MTKPAAMATQLDIKSWCFNDCAFKMALNEWQVCELEDGQLNGPGHGGQIEDKQQLVYSCFITKSDCSTGTSIGAILITF